VSATERSRFSEAFWRKQKGKGRARCVDKNVNKSGNTWSGPEIKLEQDIADECRSIFGEGRKMNKCVKTKTKEAKIGLPKPANKDGTSYWPCLRYGIPKSQCKFVERSSADLSDVKKK